MRHEEAIRAPREVGDLFRGGGPCEVERNGAEAGETRAGIGSGIDFGEVGKRGWRKKSCTEVDSKWGNSRDFEFRQGFTQARGGKSGLRAWE